MVFIPLGKNFGRVRKGALDPKVGSSKSVSVRDERMWIDSVHETVVICTADETPSVTARGHNAVAGSYINNLTYNGREMSLCMIMGAMKPKRVFILLGINDYIGEKIDKGMEYVTRTVELIHKYAPGTEVYFQSLTPVTRNFCQKKDYRTLWDEYNAALKKLSETVDFTYVEIAERLKDEEGYLPDDWSTDREYHVNNKGIPVWIDELLDFAQLRYEQGLWTPDA